MARKLVEIVFFGFQAQAFRDFLQIYNSYRFAINEEYVVKNQKIKKSKWFKLPEK